MATIKWTITVVLLLCVLTFVIQNTVIVEVQFLVWSVATPRALLVLCLVAVGFVIGYLLASLSRLNRSL